MTKSEQLKAELIGQTVKSQPQVTAPTISKSQMLKKELLGSTAQPTTTQPVTTTTTATQPISHAQKAQQGIQQAQEKYHATEMPMTAKIQSGQTLTPAETLRYAEEQGIDQTKIDKARKDLEYKSGLKVSGKIEDEIKDNNLLNEVNSKKYFEYQDKLDEAKKSGNIKDEIAYQSLLDKMDEAYKPMTKQMYNIKKPDMDFLLGQAELFSHDVKRAEDKYLEAKTYDEQVNAAENYLKTYEKYEKAAKDYQDALLYEKYNNNPVLDELDIWAYNSANTMAGLSEYLLRRTHRASENSQGVGFSSIKTADLMNYNNEIKQGIFNPQISMPYTTMYALKYQANKADAGEDIKNLYNQIVTGTFEGTEDDIRKILDDEADRQDKFQRKEEIQGELQRKKERFDWKYEPNDKVKYVLNATEQVASMAPVYAATAINPSLGDIAMYASAADEAYNQARTNGATVAQATVNSDIKGTLEAASEHLVTSSIDKAVGRVGLLAPSEWAGQIGNPILRTGVGFTVDAVGEGLEEVPTTILDPIVDRLTFNPDAPLATAEEVWASFADSLLPTLMLEGIGATVQGIDNYAAKVESKVNSSYMADLQKAELINQIENGKKELLKQVEARKAEIEQVQQTQQVQQNVTQTPTKAGSLVTQQPSIANTPAPNINAGAVTQEINTEPTKITTNTTLNNLRNFKEVGNKKINAYQYENPEVKPFFQYEASMMLDDLNNAAKGEKWANEVNGEMLYSGTKRSVTTDIADLLDGNNGVKLSYDDIRKGLNAIINDNGAENIAAAKRIELVLDKRLREGYTDSMGYAHDPSENYNKFLNGQEYMPPEQYDYEQLTKEYGSPEGLTETQQNEITNYINDLNKNTALDANFKENILSQFDNLNNYQDFENIKQEVNDYTNNIAASKIEQTKEPEMSEEPIDDTEDKIAQLLKERPQRAKMTKKEIAENAYKTLVNKGYFVDKLADASDNPQLKYKYDKMLASANEGNYVVGEKQTDNEGNIIGKSVNEIWKPVEDAGKVEEFSDYLLHKLNIDRMSLEDVDAVIKANTELTDFIKNNPDVGGLSPNKLKKLAKGENETAEKARKLIELDRQAEILENRKNKPVFGENVTADDSRKIVAEYEKKYPEFVEWSNDIKTFNKNQLQNMVDAGLASEETQELLNNMYDNYIRIQREMGGDRPIVNQRGRLKINSPIKKAKGGNQDILPLKDSMAQQAVEVKKAIARNQFGLELLDTLGNGESIEDYGEVLQPGKNGEPATFTVFKDGKPVTMKINNELYDAIKPSDRATWEDSVVAQGLQKAVVLQKTLLTSRNPLFALTNFARDLQTAIINSKDTPKMLNNYRKLAQYKIAEYLNGKTNNVRSKFGKESKELNSKYDESARLWELYKANGGESNTYFDFEKGTNLEPTNPASKVVERIFALNEMIEQLPRVSEFITTLENGGTIEEAMYNAADITVNFKRGGEFTKMLDRNGASFLNASVQGLDKQIRNITDTFKSKNRAKAFTNLVIKAAALGITPSILNHLLLHDDEDYQDLPDYIKDRILAN